MIADAVRKIAPFILCVLLAGFAPGCTVPPYETGLDEVLEEEGRSSRTRYGYRCTMGAHRGASDKYRENSRAALLSADHNRRYAFVEFDVQYSRDNRIVVYHDRTLWRLDGMAQAVGEMTFAELSEATGGEIAAYDEVAPLLKKKVNIEIKSQGDDREDERLVDEIMRDVLARKREKDVLISSISSSVVRYVGRKYPEVPTGRIFWITSSTYLHLDVLTKRLFDELSETQADYLMMHVANLRNIEDLVEFKPSGKTLVFWDFDDTMFIVHKDLSDRLWGDSWIRNLFQHVRYKLASPFQRRT